MIQVEKFQEYFLQQAVCNLHWQMHEEELRGRAAFNTSAVLEIMLLLI